MKNRILIHFCRQALSLCVFLSIFLFLISPFSLLGRTWTTKEGNSFEGTYLGMEADTVLIRHLGDLRIRRIPLTLLSTEDQTYLTKQNKSSPRYTPSTSRAFQPYFPANLETAYGQSTSTGRLTGKYVGIYFSAHWCGPCRRFTPTLVDFRDRNQSNFEVVFVSSDRSPKAMKQYMREAQMKWLHMKLGSKEARDLKQRFQVNAIPTLIILSPEGKVLTQNGRSLVNRNPKGGIELFKNFQISSNR